MNNRLSIQDLALILSEQTGKSTEEALRFLQEFIAVVSEGVYNDKLVKVKGLGTFKIIRVEERASVSVNSGERFVIPSHYKFTFTPDKELKELVNKPFSLFDTVELNEEVDFSDVDVSAETSGAEEAADDSSEEILPDGIPEQAIEAPQTPEPEVKPEPAVEEEAVPQKEAKAESEAETETTPEPEVETEPEPKAEAETTPQEEVEAEPKAETETMPEPEVEAEPEPKVEAETTPQEEAKAEPKQAEPVPSVSGYKEYRRKRRRSASRKLLFPIACLFVVIVLGIVYIVCLSGRTTVNKNWEPPMAEVGNPTPEAGMNPVPADSTGVTPPDSASLAADSVVAEPPVVEENQPEETPKSGILALVTIKAGDRLASFAKQYYGHKFFWVYIYQYNQDIISDPNNIPIGTELRIPDPGLYGIDATDRSSIDKAAALQSQILGKFSK
ncbi:HU family DNA-binding protein [Parabacteroides sp. AGMB00274]|uniref:HU family DNA-binding protein n=1 Tax=Parabacteroides faecalis TaxID=2924040 RepID=A0ABT0BZS2_9BACT|nr:HU family DNA-binding protein [Parabacteroides faecalis]MCI7287021.1 HU family DNA-binding protein [Parabacteroides sp.]MCJ2380237.1 HU family DNA-binding protein [Parabacteroides faecalis]MDY6254975.1 HU family DNA-binding protein [Bacteroidales bacterium]